MGFESTSDMETKEFCGAARPSRELKRKERNSYCPLNAPEKFIVDLLLARPLMFSGSSCQIRYGNLGMQDVSQFKDEGLRFTV